MQPASTRLNVEKLAKILALTTSPSDGEALAAARMAAKIMAEANLTYRELLTSDGGTQPPPLVNASRGDADLAWKKVEELRRELAKRWGEKPAAPQPPSTSNRIARLKDQLLAEKPLREWERRALLEFKQIQPQSREAYYILWLVRRYALAG